MLYPLSYEGKTKIFKIPQSYLKNKIYVFFPQHFLNLRPFPQMQGSLRPIFGLSRVIGIFGWQHSLSLQQALFSSSVSLDNSSLFLLILFKLAFLKFLNKYKKIHSNCFKKVFEIKGHEMIILIILLLFGCEIAC